jgi:hypothetical protein
MNDEIRVSSCKGGVPKDEAPSVIVEQTFIKGDRVVVREYDANAPSDPPKVKQVCFQDPHEEGAICVDWSKDKVEILELLCVDYYIYDPNEKKMMRDDGELPKCTHRKGCGYKSAEGECMRQSSCEFKKGGE